MSDPFERKGIRPIRDPEMAAWMKRLSEDGNWFLSQPEHSERYLGLVVILYNREVYATGRDHIEAWENARKRAEELEQPLPPRSELLPVPMPTHLFDENGFAVRCRADLVGMDDPNPA